MSSDQEAVRKAGFYTGNPSFLGASPDGVVETTSFKIIEIKCPYSYRDLTQRSLYQEGLLLYIR